MAKEIYYIEERNALVTSVRHLKIIYIDTNIRNIYRKSEKKKKNRKDGKHIVISSPKRKHSSLKQCISFPRRSVVGANRYIVFGNTAKSGTHSDWL